MKNTQIVQRGVLDDRQLLSELVEEVDPVIGEASSAIGAMTTEIVRRALRGGVLQVGREISQFVGNEVHQQIVEQQPLIEKTAAITATEVVRNEVEALRQAATEQDQRLTGRIDDATRQSQEQTQTIARDLAGRLEETSKKVEVVARTADDTARQTSQTAAQLSRSLESEVAAVETRTLESARKELSEQVEILRERARNTTAKFIDRLDKQDAATAQLAALQTNLKQELIDAMRIERKQLLKELQAFRRTNELLLKRVEILEQPRGLRALFSRVFGKKRPKLTETAKSEFEEG